MTAQHWHMSPGVAVANSVSQNLMGRSPRVLILLAGGDRKFGNNDPYKAQERPRGETPMELKSVITCPQCGHAREETMPGSACLYFYKCTRCGTVLRPKAGDCCVFCSYGSLPLARPCRKRRPKEILPDADMNRERLSIKGPVLRLIALAAVVGVVGLALGVWRLLLEPRGEAGMEHSPSSETASGPGAAGSGAGNHLVNETSPYLLMHAHNPVDWYPWGKQAFEKAKKEDKPVFLSVGYSTCYWCQVMERESFTNLGVAEVMNKHFVSIKVDREQRPDIDEQYMLATQLMTGRGGWPNSVWLTPDGKPWMAGTYWPRAQFLRILDRTAELWRTRRKDAEQQAEELAEAIRQIGAASLSAEEALGTQLSPSLLDGAVDRYRISYDEKHGGFGGAPKFPPHGALGLLFAEYRRTGDQTLLPMITGTLDAMWLGGLHDHLGGGFHRYSTDAEWLVPHFEKMLYDNAQLMRLYAEGYELTGERRYREAVDQIYAWLQRKMTGAQGGFYSAIDAEVDGEEGESYVWLHKEIFEVLGEEDGRFFAGVYNTRSGGNYAEEASGQKSGRNILHLSKPVEQIAAERGLEAEALRRKLADMRRRLLERRLKWVQPEIDDKVLTAWNGLAIEALAHAGRLLDEPRYTRAAEQAAAFVLETLYRDDRLLRSYRAGKAELLGYLDDHAYLAAGLLELYRATGNARWLAASQRLADTMLADFQDADNGGFFFTSAKGHEELLVRSRNLSGGGNVPNANGVAAQALIELARVTGRAEYRDAAERTLHSLAGLMQQSSFGMESALAAASRLYRHDEPESDRPPPPFRPEREGEPPDARAQAGPVAIEAYVSHLRAAAGQTFYAAIALDIREGWHLYGENPEIDFLVPTKVEMVPVAGLETMSLREPKSHRKTDPILNQSVSSYVGRVWFLQTIRVTDDAQAGERNVTFRIRTQACDRSRCLPPQTAEVTLPVAVNATGDAARHGPVFDQLTEREDGED